jgi:hypothetical protein
MSNLEPNWEPLGDQLGLGGRSIKKHLFIDFLPSFNWAPNGTLEFQLLPF